MGYYNCSIQVSATPFRAGKIRKMFLGMRGFLTRSCLARAGAQAWRSRWCAGKNAPARVNGHQHPRQTAAHHPQQSAVSSPLSHSGKTLSAWQAAPAPRCRKKISVNINACMLPRARPLESHPSAGKHANVCRSRRLPAEKG